MKLKYIKGHIYGVYWGKFGKRFLFTPIGDVPDDLAQYLLKTRNEEFEIVSQQDVSRETSDIPKIDNNKKKKKKKNFSIYPKEITKMENDK